MSEFVLRYFGEIWEAGMFDGDEPHEQIDVPTDLTCMTCQEHFAEGDQGTVNLGGWAQHKECGLRSVMGGIGHHVDHDRYCREEGPDAGLPTRVSAILVWHWYTNRCRFTVNDLEVLRRHVA